MPTINRDGVNIYYEDHGTGPAILLSHGYSSTTRMWTGQVEALQDRYRIITWDMRGHGQSDSPDEPTAYSEAATVDDMAAILQHLGIENAVIGGLSLGGYMSLAFNLAHPSMVRALMLFDTGPGYKNPVGREGWNVTAMKRAHTFETRGLDALGASAEVRVSQHRSAQGLAHAARGMLAQFDSRIIESLEGIAVPTLVLVGEDDQPFLGATDYMAKKIPGSKKVTIPAAGHAANLDQPAAFNAEVEKFLATL
ncbi:MAG: alpha/beta fold hydrolase [Dehalococcoidia bacterium]|uniref:alpha/beta fold hydrolase n=1 Tax=Candidatus Amarobacter glycogenicus TaxID=3140699 RepID=UPI0031363F25|nr:alpha/beta fold hydrolase [Dehalococcoidia bacterium]MBK7330279.1 alpha/beta fold hydrolase [Dehalococcoidia bacterium]MBK8560132.1 alpha/beta fold hydrolase [Dehalococcoidia bacterium]MCC6269033.1 alpha/beta fold hydrolase [Dehalococcoidia bacterium]